MLVETILRYVFLVLTHVYFSYRMKTFKGSYFEIGKQQGEIYRSNGTDLQKIKVNKAVLDKQLKLYRKHYPELLDEIKGMSVGGGFDLEKLLQIYLAGEIEWFTKRFKMPLNCTVIGVKNTNGVFVGRNLDWLPITKEVMCTYKRAGVDCNSFIAVSDMNIDSPEDVTNKLLFYNTIDVINDKGLFIGITFAYGSSWSYGLSWRDMSKLIAEKCSTVDEALKIFENVPLSVPKNFFIADSNGDMIVVEHNSNKYKVIYPQDGVLIHTNHYLDPELSLEDKVLKEIPYQNTYIRYYEALQRINFNKQNLKLGDIIKILGSPNTYIRQDHEIKTIWTLALDMKRSKYLLYTDILGTPKQEDLVF